MGRWSHLDSDEERLPEGFTRIGYDADDQTYTFRASDGSIWESAPGNQYGPLSRVSGPPVLPQPSRDSYDDGDDTEGLLQPPPYLESEPAKKVSWRAEMMPLFNFFLIIGLFLIGVFFYLRSTARGMDQAVDALQCGSGSAVYKVRPDDTCWALANGRGLSVDALLKDNANLDCDKLMVGQKICLPTT